jgi:acetyl esterase/lipase
MKYIFCLILSFSLSIQLFSQCDTSRYYFPQFENVYKHANLKYGEAVVWYVPYSNQDLLMDVYEPIGDENIKRPLMIWVHPGGFLLGDKEAEDMVALCDSFAKRGYVTASVGYRLGFNPIDSESAERAVYRGTQDVRAAIRYLKEYASVFGIDTNSIFVGGSSAGGVASLHVAYLDQEEAPIVVYGDGNLVPDLNLLDSSGNNFNHTVTLKGIVNLWGALGDSTFIDADETVPALLVHGMEDGVVPFGVGHPFSVSTTPLVHGSRAISNQLDFYGIPHTNLFFQGQDHEPHGTSNGYWEGQEPTPYWDSIFNAINQHYYSILRPRTQNLLGESVVCENSIESYVLEGQTEAIRTCWNVSGGEILEETDTNIVVQWFSNGSIKYRQFTSGDAASREIEFNVTVNSSPNAEFSFSNLGSSFTFQANDLGLLYNWNFFELGTSTEANPVLEINENGLFPVLLSVQNQFNCTDTVESQILQLSASIADMQEHKLKVYPNPFENEIHISLIDESFEFKILDLLGKEIMNGNGFGEETINLDGFITGTYFLNIEFSGQKLVTRIVKQ